MSERKTKKSRKNQLNDENFQFPIMKTIDGVKIMEQQEKELEDKAAQNQQKKPQKKKRFDEVYENDNQIKHLVKEFQDTIKTEETKEKMGDKNNQFSNLLNEILSKKKVREKKLIQEYKQLEKYVQENEENSIFNQSCLNLSNKSGFIQQQQSFGSKFNNNTTTIVNNSTQNFSKIQSSSIQTQQFSCKKRIDGTDKSYNVNNSQEKLVAANYDENIIALQIKIASINQKLEIISDNQMVEENKAEALLNQQKDIEKTTHTMKQDINSFQNIIKQYKTQLTEVQEKELKYKQQQQRIQFDINNAKEKFNKMVQSKQNDKLRLEDKMDNSQQHLNQAVNEFKKLQGSIKESQQIYDKTFQKLEEESNKLKHQCTRMVKSIKLNKELEYFDLLTNNFIYSEPAQEVIEQLKLKIQKDKEFEYQQFSNSQDQLTQLMTLQKFENGQAMHIYKQGTIISRLKQFFKDHNNELNKTVDKVIYEYNEMNLQNNTLEQRLQDLQEQKRLIEIELRKMGEQPEQIKQFPNKIIDFEYVEKEIENQQGEKVIKIERIEDKSVKEHQIKNDLLNRQLDSKLQFISHVYLFIIDCLFRFAGMAGVIRNITVSNPAVEKDFKFQDDLFKKEFYNNLGQIMSFYNQNKGYLTKIEFKKQTEKNEVKVEIKDKKNILEESKIIALKQKIKEKIPQIKADTIINYIMKDFILLYFCDMELYEDTLEKFVYYPQAQISQEIQFLNLINMELKSEKGFYKFLDCLTQGLEYMQGYLDNLKFIKDELSMKLLNRIPDFQLPNEDFMKTKKQDNLEKTLRKLGEKVDAKNQVVLKKIKSIAGHQQLLEIQLEDTKDDSMSTSQLSQISHKKVILNSQIEDNKSFLQEEKKLNEKIEMERQYKREKLNEHYQQMLQIENEQKKKFQWDYMNKPKIISKYQESSKFDAKYYESKKFLVEQKNKFSKLTSKAYIKQLSRHNLAKIQLAKIQAENGNTGPLDAKTQEALLKSNNIIQSDTKDIRSNSSAKRNFSAPKFRKDQNVSSFHMPKLGANQPHNGNTISGITVQSNNFASSTGINKNNQKRSSFGLRTEIKKGRSITSQAQFFNTNQKLSVI